MDSKKDLLFDDDSLVNVLLPEERISNTTTAKPYIIFKRNGDFQIEIFPILTKHTLKEYYGDNYEIFYDAFTISDEMLDQNKISFVRTSIGEIKKQLDQVEKETKKVFTRYQKR